MSIYWPSLLGGILIGLSASFLLLANGTVAGISGIVGRLAQGIQFFPNAAFVLGMLVGPLIYRAAFSRFPTVTITARWPVILLAGVLVGFGARMGSGCTSGHGVIGLARLSKRSAMAVAMFLATGIATVTLMRLTGL